MPTHRKRPRDPAQLAKLMIDIASGEIEDLRIATGETEGAGGGGDRGQEASEPLQRGPPGLRRCT
jgi:hypothetical protein